MYKCSGCGAAYCTGEAFDRHLANHPSCASRACAELLKAGADQELHRLLDRLEQLRAPTAFAGLTTRNCGAIIPGRKS